MKVVGLAAVFFALSFGSAIACTPGDGSPGCTDPGTPPPQTICPHGHWCPMDIEDEDGNAIVGFDIGPLWAAGKISPVELVKSIRKWQIDPPAPRLTESSAPPGLSIARPGIASKGGMFACYGAACGAIVLKEVLATGNPAFPQLSVYQINGISLAK